MELHAKQTQGNQFKSYIPTFEVYLAQYMYLGNMQD